MGYHNKLFQDYFENVATEMKKNKKNKVYGMAAFKQKTKTINSISYKILDIGFTFVKHVKAIFKLLEFIIRMNIKNQ